jgi:hypothetical protein
MGAHPTNLPRRHTHHQSEWRNIAIHHSTSTDKRMVTNAHTADNGAVCPKRGTRLNQGGTIFVLSGNRGAWIIDVREYHAWATENIILKRHIIINGHIILNLDIIADVHTIAYKHILSEGTSLSDHGAGADVNPVPDTTIGTDRSPFIH